MFSDAETGAVLRIELQCEIPPDSEYTELELTLDYKPAEVAGRPFVLPSHYHMHSRSEADYRNYRRFDADSSITFDK